ncbi:hypothetical protein PT274_03465 [Leuconostocaceae bacterium ESL0958]|nr:hypothetical protein [Leuconostocaceae bacterium ESL0958]
MEQEQVMRRFESIGYPTLKGVTKALAIVTGVGVREAIRAGWQKARPIRGEVSYERLMAQNTAKELELLPDAFRDPANLDKLKNYLSEKGIAFSFRHQPNGRTELLYQVKNQALAKRALADFLEDLQNPHKDFFDSIRRSKEPRASEQVKAARQKQAPTKTKTARKQMRR